MKSKLTTLIDEIFNTKELQNDPPILVDLGASEAIHKAWKILAPYSICIAFDADDRDFSDKINNSTFKKFHLINKIVSDKTTEAIPFYLTSSPYCSSSLEPENTALEDWKFHKLFEVEKRIKLPNTSLKKVLEDLNITKIDWFKTDTQGTDLTLFKSLSEEMQRNVIIAEFEPGIIDAYKGEDKLHHVLAFMDKMPFWAMSMKVCGTQRISKATLSKYQLDFDSPLNMPRCCCWAEIIYFNTFKTKRNDRDILLGWVIATIKNQHGFALELLLYTVNTILPDLLNNLISFSENKIINRSELSSIKQRIKNKLISYI